STVRRYAVIAPAVYPPLRPQLLPPQTDAHGVSSPASYPRMASPASHSEVSSVEPGASVPHPPAPSPARPASPLLPRLHSPASLLPSVPLPLLLPVAGPVHVDAVPWGGKNPQVFAQLDPVVASLR